MLNLDNDSHAIDGIMMITASMTTTSCVGDKEGRKEEARQLLRFDRTVKRQCTRVLELSTPGLAPTIIIVYFSSFHSARPRALRLRLWLCGSGFYSLPKLWILSTSGLLSFACFRRYLLSTYH